MYRRLSTFLHKATHLYYSCMDVFEAVAMTTSCHIVKERVAEGVRVCKSLLLDNLYISLVFFSHSLYFKKKKSIWSI